MGDSQVTTQLSRLFDARSAQLNKVFFDNLQVQDPAYKKCFRMEKAMNKGMFEVEDQMTGFSNLSERGQLQESATDRLYSGYKTTWTYADFSLLYEYSEQMLEADMDGLIAKATANLSMRAVDYIDSDFWNMIVNGFGTTTTGDGLYLFDTGHLNARGDTQDNILSNAIDLGYDNVQLLLNLVRKTRDHSGYNYLNLPVKQLWVPPELEWTAMKVFPQAGGSIYNPDNANLATNVVNQKYKGIEIIVTPKITDSNMFVFSAGKDICEVKGKLRRAIRLQHEKKDISKGSYEMMVDVRYDIQAHDWIGLWASPGT